MFYTINNSLQCSLPSKFFMLINVVSNQLPKVSSGCYLKTCFFQNCFALKILVWQFPLTHYHAKRHLTLQKKNCVIDWFEYPVSTLTTNRFCRQQHTLVNFEPHRPDEQTKLDTNSTTSHSSFLRVQTGRACLIKSLNMNNYSH